MASTMPKLLQRPKQPPADMVVPQRSYPIGHQLPKAAAVSRRAPRDPARNHLAARS
jgi:hypothetical protein